MAESEQSSNTAWRNGAYAAQLALLTCAGFGAVGSFVLALKLASVDFQEDGLVLRLVIKGAFFVGILVTTLWSIRRSRYQETKNDERPVTGSKSVSPFWVIACFTLVILLAYPSLSRHPWTAPDELYHLVVARNLAVHDAYASGNPARGFTYFDHYDSVGVTVLGPIALAFKVFSVNLSVARAMIATSFVLLAIATFLFARRFWGSAAACISVVTMTLSFGTIYLGRSLYGEVPALMFFLLAMIAWDESLNRKRFIILGTLTGSLWGCAVLTKSFMALTAFPIIAVWLMDRLTRKEIPYAAVCAPAVGAIAVLGSWAAITMHYSYLKSEDISMLVYYRHSLMFGLQSVGNATHWFLESPVYTWGLVATVVWFIRHGAQVNARPSVWVLFMVAALYLFWWFFYTPGTLPRYLWYSCAAIGIFMGPALLIGWNSLRHRELVWTKRAIAAGFMCVVLVPASVRLWNQANRNAFQDNTLDERNLAEYLGQTDSEIRIATGYPPAVWSIDFFTGRNVEQIDFTASSTVSYDLLVLEKTYNMVRPKSVKPTEIGRYLVYTLDETEIKD